MRSPLWFVVAAIVGIGGFVVAALYLIPRLSTIEDRMMQVVMPGSATLRLTEPATYTIYLEKRSVVDGRIYTASSLGGLRVTVQAPDGSNVPLKSGGSASYKISGREGFSVLAFDVATPGDYRITGTMPDGRSEPKLVLAVASGLLGGMFGLIGSAIGIAFGGLAIAGIIIVATLWQRQKAKRA